VETDGASKVAGLIAALLTETRQISSSASRVLA
jgi:hypothetical protein